MTRFHCTLNIYLYKQFSLSHVKHLTADRLHSFHSKDQRLCLSRSPTVSLRNEGHESKTVFVVLEIPSPTDVEWFKEVYRKQSR